ncbi:hypothetical protein [Butyrivibrio sp. FC2001]|uniref:hypothetical protein n=1 Tax=Butyrivibrio sp. FC2001 TaxID=1280671 RepID=UPI0003F4E1FF|nr:hypothetical protein [Butyrivibrio sp. FC2001]
MRKRLFVAITLALSIMLTACGSNKASVESNSTEETQDSNLSAEDSAKQAYEVLNASADSADRIMSSVLAAWYFSIDKGNDYVLEDYYSGVYDFSNDLGLDTSAVDTAFKEVIKGTTYETMFTSQAFKEPAICVKLALQCYQDAGIIDTTKELLSDAKQDIKNAESAEPSASYLEDLKKYHSEIQSYLDYTLSPTGSYKDCSSEVETYRANLKTFKNNLAFDLE